MNQFLFLQEWFKKRSVRDQQYLFLIGFIFLFLIFYLIFLKPVSVQKTDLRNKIIMLQAQQITFKQEREKINAAIASPDFLKMLAEKEKLNSQLSNMQQQVNHFQTDLFTSEAMPNLTKKILSQQRNNVILVSLKELPVEAWPPLDPNTKKNPFDSVSEGYQHLLQIDFQNDYVSTIAYLKHLETISKHLYWDNMHYKVLQYPKAYVVIKFHVLSLQKS